MLVMDYSAYSYALHDTVKHTVLTVWPTWPEVDSAAVAALLGNYHCFKKLCLWYHKLPLYVDSAQLVISRRVSEGYKLARPMYQKKGQFYLIHTKENE